MDFIRFSCSQCGKSIKVDAKYAGRAARCPNCKAAFTIPVASEQTPAAARGDEPTKVASKAADAKGLRAASPVKAAATAKMTGDAKTSPSAKIAANVKTTSDASTTPDAQSPPVLAPPPLPPMAVVAGAVAGVTAVGVLPLPPAAFPPVEEKPPGQFGQQAAKFSLYAPLVALGVGVLAYGNRNQLGVAMAIGGINILIILAGLVLGIVALFLMRTQGRKGILVRAIIGVCVNGIFVAAMLMLVATYVVAGQAKNQVVGHWRMMANGGKTQYDVTFNKDNTLHFEETSDTTPVSFDGHWEMPMTQIVSITIDHVIVGDPNAVGKTIGLGRVRTVTNTQMVMQTDNGDETYDRVP